MSETCLTPNEERETPNEEPKTKILPVNEHALRQYIAAGAVLEDGHYYFCGKKLVLQGE